MRSDTVPPVAIGLAAGLLTTAVAIGLGLIVAATAIFFCVTG